MEKISFEVGSETVLIRNVGKNQSEIVNYNETIIMPCSNKKIIDNNCKIFGSSLAGRIESSKEWLGYDYKLPIIIDEIRSLIFFPTKSIDSINNIWISYNNIDDYKASKDGIIVTLKNGSEILIEESYNIFENQYIRAHKLYKRIEKLKAAITK